MSSSVDPFAVASPRTAPQSRPVRQTLPSATPARRPPVSPPPPAPKPVEYADNYTYDEPAPVQRQRSPERVQPSVNTNRVKPVIKEKVRGGPIGAIKGLFKRIMRVFE